MRGISHDNITIGCNTQGNSKKARRKSSSMAIEEKLSVTPPCNLTLQDGF
jgi:hypothetical protein